MPIQYDGVRIVDSAGNPVTIGVGDASAANQLTQIAAAGAAADVEATGDGSTIAILKRLRTLLAGGLPATLGQKTAANSLAVISASDDPVAVATGAQADVEATANGSLVAILKRLRTLLAGGLPASIGQKTGAASLAVVLASDDPVAVASGAQADAEATANGSIIAILKRLRTLLAGGLPATLGQKTAANSLAVISASDDPVTVASGAPADAEATANGSIIAILKRLRTLLGGVLLVNAEGQKATYQITNVVSPIAGNLIVVQGAAGRVLRVRRVALSAHATTAGDMRFTFRRESTASTGGTSVALAVHKLDSRSGAFPGVSTLYTAAPTAGTLDAHFAIRHVHFPVMPAVVGEAAFEFGRNGDQSAAIVGASEFFVVNLAGTVPAGGTISVNITITDEPV